MTKQERESRRHSPSSAALPRRWCVARNAARATPRAEPQRACASRRPYGGSGNVGQSDPPARRWAAALRATLGWCGGPPVPLAHTGPLSQQSAASPNPSLGFDATLSARVRRVARSSLGFRAARIFASTVRQHRRPASPRSRPPAPPWRAHRSPARPRTRLARRGAMSRAAIRSATSSASGTDTWSRTAYDRRTPRKTLPKDAQWDGVADTAPSHVGVALHRRDLPTRSRPGLGVLAHRPGRFSNYPLPHLPDRTEVGVGPYVTSGDR